MQLSVSDAIENDARAFLDAWFGARRIVQTLNFNRFQQEGLSASQFILLTMLGEGSASAAELARKLNVDVTTTMRTAESLAARGLLSKARDTSDRRRTALALTPAGEDVHARIQSAFVAQIAAAFSAMPPPQRAGLVNGLSAFVAAVDATVKPDENHAGGGQDAVTGE